MPTPTIHIAPSLPDGDEYALFTHLFRRYAPRIFYYFKKYVKQDVTAEDLLQEVFANVWSKRDGLLKEKNIEAYLFVSARNQLYNHLKRSLAKEPVSLPADSDAMYFSYQHVEEDMLYKEVVTNYQEALSSLSTQRRKAFLLSREQGLSYQQIAQVMGISPRTVEKHISDALQILRHTMGPSYFLALLFIIW